MENKNRALVRILRKLAEEYGIEYQSFSYDWVIKLTKNGESRVVLGYGFPLNSATGAALCSDKAAASALMRDAGVPCVQHHFFMRPSLVSYIGARGNWAELIEMLGREKELVCKPNEGTCGNQTFRVSDAASLEGAVEKIFSTNRGMAVCRYHDIRSEHRVIALDGRALVIFRKSLPYVIGDGHSSVAMLSAQKYPALASELASTGHVPSCGERVSVGWRHNLDKGSTPELLDLSTPLAKKLEKLAADASSACGVRFASIDIISVEEQSEPMVLEVNSGVMMERFAAHSDEFYGIAKETYRKALLAMW